MKYHIHHELAPTAEIPMCKYLVDHRQLENPPYTNLAKQPKLLFVLLPD